MDDVIRLVVVDDDPLVRTGLGLIVGGAADLQVVGEAADGEEALAVVGELRPDVVLMDIRMPRRDGISATQSIVGRPGAPKVLVLTTFDSDDFVLRALQAGAAGFLLKDTAPPRMIEAIRAVATGERALSPSVLAQVIAAATGASSYDRQDAARRQLQSLNERELDVAKAVGRGLSNAEIAAELYLSVATVKAHVTRIFDKLGLDNRVQVAMRVHDAGLG